MVRFPPENPLQCLIITSYVEGVEKLDITAEDYDLIICADGGLKVEEKMGLLSPDGATPSGKLPPLWLIGDYDSSELPNETERAAASELTILPTVKDMTDTEAAIDLAVEKGYGCIHVLGGLGGRFDHSMGNLGMLEKYVEDDRVQELCFEDGRNLVFMKAPGCFSVGAYGKPLTFRKEQLESSIEELQFKSSKTGRDGKPNRFKYFSLVAYGGPVEGLTITGAKYELPAPGIHLEPNTTLGISNEVASGKAEISHNSGHLLVMLSSD